jgi:hypothetical protein
MKRELSEEQKIAKVEYARQWRLKNPEKAREHARRSREKNREKVLARQRIWREANRERSAQKSRTWYEANRDRVRARSRFKTFGVTAEQYQALLDRQGNRCAICRTTEPGKGECFAVDHDHATGLIRGLLCVHCNVGLGHFRDDTDLLELAVAYLRDRRENAARQGTSGPRTCS